LGRRSKAFGICALLGAAALWVATSPQLPLVSSPTSVDLAVAQKSPGDVSNGALVFAAAGCASCHSAPNGSDKAQLGGGQAFASDFGTFYAPNISSDPQHGIGSWDVVQFAQAVTRGVSPQGRHYYPAFPYTAYRHMTPRDVVDLFAFMRTLRADPTPSKAHDVGFPFNIRRGLGLWKLLYARGGFVLSAELTPVQARGRYLVEGLAHCGECHTARGALGGLDRTRWMQGAPSPSGDGKIPGITPALLDWSERDLMAYFTSGFTPDYDSAGGKMAEVVENLAQLPESDRAAIAAYLKALP